MIVTNLLIRIGFSLVTNFSDTLNLPERPREIEDIQRYLVSSPRSPLDLYLVARNGDQFRIKDGTVYSFTTTNSFKDRKLTDDYLKFEGKLVLQSNEVVKIASDTIWHLIKDKSLPLKVAPLTVNPKNNGKPTSFWWIT